MTCRSVREFKLLLLSIRALKNMVRFPASTHIVLIIKSVDHYFVKIVMVRRGHKAAAPT